MRKQNGRFTYKIRWNEVGVVALLVIVIAGFCMNAARAKATTTEPTPAAIEATDDEPSPCVEVSSGTRSYVCTDAATLAKWQKYLESEIDKLNVEAGKPRAILYKVCRDRGFMGDDCPSVLYGMAMAESRMNANAIGDGGKSRGWYQIHAGYHPNVTDACKKSLSCASAWTLDRMIAKGFAKDMYTAIMRHNGTPNIPATKAYLKTVLSFAKDF